MSRRKCSKRQALPVSSEMTKRKQVFVGFDGSIDRTLRPLRRTGAEKKYFRTIAQFGDYIASKAGLSCSIQTEIQWSRAGGNAPYVASALKRFGYDVCLAGMLGNGRLREEFLPLESAGIHLYSYADPESSDCYEFEDGKIMIAPLVPSLDAPLEAMQKALGGGIQELLNSDLAAMLNWGEINWMQRLWDGAVSMLKEKEGKRTDKFVFFDPADISCCSAENIMRMMETLKRAAKYRYSVLSVNENEALRLGEAIFDGMDIVPEILRRVVEDGFADEAVVHTVHGACGFDGERLVERSAEHVSKPLISTGAGDHFNAGYCAALLEGEPLGSRLDRANRSAHAYLTTGKAAGA